MDFEKIGKETGVKNRQAILEQICDVVSRWPEYAQSAGVEKSLYKKIGDIHETHINV